MTDFKKLFRRLQSTPFPSDRLDIGNIELYDSMVAGYASRLAGGFSLPAEAAELEPDDETLKAIEELRSKKSPTPEDRAILAYWALLDEARQAVVAEARRRLR